MDFSTLTEGYLLTCRTEGKAQSTLRIYEKVLRRFAKHLGKDLDVADIEAKHIREFLDALAHARKWETSPYVTTQNEPLSPYYIDIHRRALRAFLNWCVREGYLKRSPMATVRPAKLPEKLIKTLTAKEIQALFYVIEQNKRKTKRRDLVIVSFFLDTGVRSGELIRLKLSDINLDGGYARIEQGKGQKDRIVPLGASLLRLLWRYIHQYRPEPFSPLIENVFLTQDGRPMQISALAKQIKRYGKQAGIERLNCYLLRHTSATLYLRASGDLEALRKILGHKDIHTTLRYTHLLATDIISKHRLYSPLDRIKFGKLK